MKNARLEVTRFISKYFPPNIKKKNMDWDWFESQYDEIQSLMEKEHLWFEDGHNYGFRPAKNKKIALGRIYFYVEFADFLYEKYNDRYYLLDYMARIERGDGQASLSYYIEDADEIHINLEGITKETLRASTIGIGKEASSKDEIGADCTTAWEINQVFYKGLINKAYFHTGSYMTRFQAYFAMGCKVPLKRILNDNKKLALNTQSEKDSEVLEEL